MMLAKTPAYTTIRLNLRSDESWAVVNRETGAIVLDEARSLVMRLSRQEAERIAAELALGEEVGEAEPG